MFLWVWFCVAFKETPTSVDLTVEADIPTNNSPTNWSRYICWLAKLHTHFVLLLKNHLHRLTLWSKRTFRPKTQQPTAITIHLLGYVCWLESACTFWGREESSRACHEYVNKEAISLVVLNATACQRTGLWNRCYVEIRPAILQYQYDLLCILKNLQKILKIRILQNKNVVPWQ